MTERLTWVVELFINGPIALRSPVNAQHLKGFSRRPFYSEVALRTIPSGLHCSATAFAGDSGSARKAGLVFVGEMLDVLSMELYQPLSVSVFDSRRSDKINHSVRRLIGEEEVGAAFSRSRWLSEHHPTFLRALGYFRKGLVTEDPLDQYFAYWRSLEIVADKYHPNTPNVPRGSKSHLWECFKLVWGPTESWPHIPNQKLWIDENYDVRNEIAHGTASVDVDAVERVAARGVILRDVAHQFLFDWSRSRLTGYV